MGKVTVIIESQFIPTNLLYTLCQQVIPTEEVFQAAMMKESGVSPGEVKVFIVPDEEPEEG